MDGLAERIKAQQRQKYRDELLVGVQSARNVKASAMGQSRGAAAHPRGGRDRALLLVALVGRSRA
jgi:hypothetical protein